MANIGSTYIKRIILTKVMLFVLLGMSFAQNQTKHPNVILIITDDQGYGDLGFTGNPHVKTPVIDQFAREGVRLNNFYVSPVCAPTRSSLMTGRYSLRTGIRDTYNGGAIMASSEVTIAEMLKQGPYKTGAFGKWHLGDTYPYRPNDQGFDESLIHLSGGMGQVGDITTYFKGDKSYFDPVLWHNNQKESYIGYCSDIFTNEAISFIEKNKNNSFFCYLSFNAPHTPLQVPDEYYQQYKDIDPSLGFDKDKGSSVKMSEKDKEAARKVYAMVTNIDDNIGKLLKKLDELKIADNTLIIFMTDNGPQQVRYTAGLRGRKSKVYQGGVKVPFFMKYAPLFKGNKDINTTTAHIDILPTLAEVCNVPLPKDRTIDGKNLLPLIKGEQIDWSNRSLFFYWTRRYPELYNNMALLKKSFKFVANADYNSGIEDFELYNIEEDPYEKFNIIKKSISKAQNLKNELDTIYKELINSKNLVIPPRIIVGTKHENPVILTRNDAGGARGIWAQDEIYGKWSVTIKKGKYNIKFKFKKPIAPNGKMYFEAGTHVKQVRHLKKNTDIIEMKNIHFPEMKCDFIPFYAVGSKKILPFWVEFEKLD